MFTLKQLFKLKKVFWILLSFSFILFSSSMFAEKIILNPNPNSNTNSNLDSDLYLDLVTPPDMSNNIYNFSKNTTRKIFFNISSDYLPKNTLKTTKVIYNLKTYPDNTLKQIDLSLSKTEDVFLSNIKSSFSLNVHTFNFTDNVVKVKIEAILYDEYDNLLSEKYMYLNLVSNNADYDYSLSPERTEPIFKAYSFSKDIIFLKNKSESENIVIKQYTDSVQTYNLDCKPNNVGILSFLEYKGNLEFDLNVSINPDVNLSKGIYSISCVFYNESNTYPTKDILVKYFAEEEVIEEDSSLSEIDSNISINDENKSTPFLKEMFIKIKSFFKN